MLGTDAPLLGSGRWIPVIAGCGGAPGLARRAGSLSIESHSGLVRSLGVGLYMVSESASRAFELCPADYPANPPALINGWPEISRLS
jgi:hypothetical protein